MKQKNTSKYVEMQAGASGIPMPRIIGTRIRVSLLVGFYKGAIEEGMDHAGAVQYLAESYSHLSLDEIKGALDYWRAHEDDIELEIRRDEVMDMALEMQQRSLLRVFGRE